MRNVFDKEISPWLVGSVVLGVVAYGGLLFMPSAEPLVSEAELDRMLFESDPLPAGAAIAVAAWLLWRRWNEFAALPQVRPRFAPVFFAPGILAAAWSALNDAPDWLLLSLDAHLLAFAAWTRGRAGVRVLITPAIALLFAVPLPGPFENEVIWSLQRFAASGTVWLHGLAGLGTTGDGVMLSRQGSGFLVIETCSGLRTLLILSLVSLVIRDLFRESGWRSWLAVVLAPPVACLANLVRVAWVVASGASEASAGHVSQGLSTLAAGTLILFGLAHVFCRAEPERRATTPPPCRLPWRLACGVLLVTAAVTHLIPAWPLSEAGRFAALDAFADREEWVGEDLSPDWLFLGSLPFGSVVQRRFERETEGGRIDVVELFAGRESAREPRSSPFSSNLALPARDWGVLQREKRSDWRLFLELDVVVATRGDERALVRTWRPGSERLLHETLRSLFALERGPFGRERPRTFVRLATPLLEGGTADRRAAERILDGFVVDYREALDALGEG